MQLASTAQGFSYLQKELELKQNLVGEGFARPPNEGKARINVIGEITKAERFNADLLYLTYELEKPQNWVFDNEDEDYSNEPPELLEELTRTSSTTNIAKPNVVYEEGESFPVFHYSFPLDWQFSVDEAYLSQKWPTIVVQVNSLDSWGRYRVEGYGFVELPRYCGVHHLEIRTWKPHTNQDNQAFSFFLGGSIGVKEPNSIAKTSHKLDYDEEAIVNRYNISTESAGTVYLTLNVLKQTEGVMQKARKDLRDVKYQEKLGELKMQNDDAYMTGTFNRTEGNAPALMRTENFGLISRFSHH